MRPIETAVGEGEGRLRRSNHPASSGAPTIHPLPPDHHDYHRDDDDDDDDNEEEEEEEEDVIPKRGCSSVNPRPPLKG